MVINLKSNALNTFKTLKIHEDPKFKNTTYYIGINKKNLKYN